MNDAGRIRVLLVDDQPLLRMGFRLILEGEDDLEVVGEASDGAEAIGALGEGLDAWVKFSCCQSASRPASGSAKRGESASLL